MRQDARLRTHQGQRPATIPATHTTSATSYNAITAATAPVAVQVATPGHRPCTTVKFTGRTRQTSPSSRSAPMSATAPAPTCAAALDKIDVAGLDLRTPSRCACSWCSDGSASQDARLRTDAAVSATALAVFLASSLLLLLLPGPAVLYVVSQTARLRPGPGPGRRAGRGAAALSCTHAAATVGLSALLASSEAAFAVVKYAGVAYLLVLGWRQLRAAGTAPAERPPGACPQSRRVRMAVVPAGVRRRAAQPQDGAVLPRLPPPVRGPGDAHRTTQLGLLGALFVAMALVVDGTYAVAAALVRRRARSAGAPLGPRRRDRSCGAWRRVAAAS